MTIEKINEAISKYLHKDHTDNQGFLYNKLPFDEFKDVRYYRDNKERTNFILENLPVDVNTFMDLGCTEGAMSFNLAKAGLRGVGTDYDPAAIEIASMIAEHFKLDCEFYNEDIFTFVDSLSTSNLDVCLFLSTFMWYVKQKGLPEGKRILRQLAGFCDTMFFETAGTSSKAPLPQAEDINWQIDLLRENGWHVDKYELLKSDTGGLRYIIKCSSTR